MDFESKSGRISCCVHAARPVACSRVSQACRRAIGSLERSWGVFGQVGHSGGQQSVVDGGEEPGGTQPGVGDLVAMAARDPSTSSSCPTTFNAAAST